MQTHNTSVFNDDDSLLTPSYNIAPQTFQPVVRLARETHHRELTAMRWGLIPYCILGEGCQGRIQHNQREGRDADHQSGIP
jgi:putative SOS response-associated peptidase YedK